MIAHATGTGQTIAEQGLDPITFEIIKNSLAALADEMVLTIVRTSYSGVVRDVMDFSTAFCAPNGEMLAQGLSLPLHLGSIPDALTAILDRYRDELAPGDVFALNDPYAGGMHLPDIFVIQPVFVGDRLAGFAATVCHHTDVGGRVPGSNASDSTEIYQEGLRIPPLKIYERGQPNATLFTLLEANVRVPRSVLGDLRAQLSACHVAERRYRELEATYGAEQLERYGRALLDYTEHLVRRRIAEIPDGVYAAEDYIDEDGIDPDPIPLRVTLRVEGDRIAADWTGSAPQVRGAINATLSFTKAATYAAIKCVLGPDIPNNGGLFRPISVEAPPGTIVNPVLPASCAARGLTGFRMGDVLFRALYGAVPERVPAAGEGGNTGVTIGGYARDRTPFIFVEFLSSCWGGRATRDGVDGVTNPFNNLANTPVEVVESELPLRIERFGFAPDSGGPGRFRGGLALVREYRLLEEAALLQIRSDRRRFRPYGLAGGHEGAPSHTELVRGGEIETLPAKVTMAIQHNDLVRHRTAGGGGYGDPLDRDPELVRADVRAGKVSREAARIAYGVVLSEDLTVDVSATRRLREERRRSPPARQPSSSVVGGPAAEGDSAPMDNRATSALAMGSEPDP